MASCPGISVLSTYRSPPPSRMMHLVLVLLLGLFSPTQAAGDDKLCHVCRSTTTEVDKALKHTGSKRSESDVMDVLSNICKFDSFKVYDFPPPKMVAMCKQVLDTHEETFELQFQDKSLKLNTLKEIICKSFCDGIDLNKVRKQEQPQVFMDGEPMDTDRVQTPPSRPSPTKKKKKKKTTKKKKKKNKKNSKNKKKRRKQKKNKKGEL